MTKFDKIYTFVFLTIIIGCSILTGQHSDVNIIGINLDTFYISLFASIIGVLYVVNVRLQNKYSMILGCIFSILYCILAFSNKNYGDFTVNLYCAAVCAVGFISWSKNNTGKTELVDLNKRQMIILGSIAIIIYIVLMFGLKALGTHNLYIDALIATFVIIANTLMAMKYKQLWVFFNLVNTLHVILWSIRVVEGVHNSLPVLVTFICYLINSLYATRQLNKDIGRQVMQ